MLNCGLVLFACFATSFSGFVDLKQGLSLEWSFPDPDSIKFDLSVSDDLVESIGWISLGFKSTLQGTQTTNLDGAYVIEDDDRVEDIYTLEDGIVRTDESLNSKSNIEGFEITEYESNKVFSWSRALDTGDVHDNVLVEGEDYYLHYGYGVLSNDNSIGDGLDKFEGYVEMTLSEDFGTTTSSAFLNFLN